MSGTDDKRFQLNLNSILRALAAIEQSAVHTAIGDGTVAVFEMKQDGRIEEFALILAALKLKVVAEDMRCVDMKTLEVLLHGHRKWVESISQPGDYAAGT